ncbi:MAG: TolC family protein [Tannerellaceae bacterium]|nr:TolC family protein [Tannerellaceae bacterium]MCD8264070.1 TolC family protein [Tannerellaceae bacterium]
MKKIIYSLLALAFLSVANAQLDAYPAISYGNYLNRVGKNNLSFIAEKYNVQIADAEVVSQRIFPDPELLFEASDEVFNLELGYNIELGKRSARIKVAKSEAEIERLALEYFFQDLRAEATHAYLEAMKQKELLDVKISSYEYMYQLSQSDSIRFELGEIEENEARQSRVEAISLLNEVYEQEAEYKSALATLSQFMGESIELFYLPAVNWDAFEKEYSLANLIEIAQDNRIDLMAAGKNIELANRQFRLVKAERRPDIGVSVGYERDWKGFWPARDMVKGSVSIPLMFSNINKGQVRAARFAVEKSKAEQADISLMVQTEVAHSYYAYEAAWKQVMQYRAGMLDDSRLLMEGIVYKYTRGETNILEVLITQRTYNEIQEQYLETLKGYASALVDLQRTCGIWDIDF